MNTLKIQNNWPGIRSKLKEKYAHLSDEDLTYTQGDEEKLLARLQTKTGTSRDELIKEINAYCSC